MTEASSALSVVFITELEVGEAPTAGEGAVDGTDDAASKEVNGAVDAGGGANDSGAKEAGGAAGEGADDAANANKVGGAAGDGAKEAKGAAAKEVGGKDAGGGADDAANDPKFGSKPSSCCICAHISGETVTALVGGVGALVGGLVPVMLAGGVVSCAMG